MSYTEAKTADQAVAAYRRMTEGGYHSDQVYHDFYHFFPEVAIAQAEFDTHVFRDMMAYDEKHQFPTDMMNVSAYPAPFGFEHWSDWTRAARLALDANLATALGIEPTS